MKKEEAERTWQSYTSSWSIADAIERGRLLAEILSEDAEYTDPQTRTTNRDELSRYMEGFQRQYPGGSFRLRKFHFRADESIAEWSMLDQGGATLVQGVSYACYDSSGRLVKMAGFFPVA